MTARPERLDELLVERATEGLDGDRLVEFESLLAADPAADDDGYDRAAAAIAEAFAAADPRSESLPPHLRDRLVETGRSGLRAVPALPEIESTPVQRTRSWTPWLAAAAMLVVAILGWSRSIDRSEPLSAEQRLEALLERAGDIDRWGWTATEDEAASGAGGEVIWSSAEDEGYMRISGLASNDPSVTQYQLWIFDATRSADHPVDGGVFDIPAGVDSVVVPIDPKLAVDDATLFAVTVERPGGVVVSSRERIVLLAQPAEG